MPRCDGTGPFGGGPRAGGGRGPCGGGLGRGMGWRAGSRNQGQAVGFPDPEADMREQIAALREEIRALKSRLAGGE